MALYDYETEEERKRRLAEEAAARGETPSTDWASIPGQYLDKRMADVTSRIGDVTNIFEDPEAAVRKRLGIEAQQQEAAKTTPVKQTITTDPDTGEQTMKIEGRVQDLSAANPNTPTVTGPAVPTAMPAQMAAPVAQPAPVAQAPNTAASGPVAQTQDPAEIERRAAAMRAMATPGGAPSAPAPVAPAAPAPAAQQPVQVPTQAVAPAPVAPAAAAPGASLAQQGQAAPTAPIDPNAPMPNIGTVPTPGPGIQVAGGPPGAGVAEAARAAQAAAEPAWVSAANEAGSDFNKLLDVAAKHPESRAAIQAKMQNSFANKLKEDEARKIVEAAGTGDPKAMNKLEQSLRPTKGKEREEVTVSDYLKAYMYARLGLNDLSQQVQAKIAGADTQFGQVQLGDTNWKVETNRKTGEIVRAQDDEGNVATQNTINKLSAAGVKAGSQAYGFTGGSMTIPASEKENAGQEYRQRTNSITGKIENIITTGPNAGKVYTGSPGFEKRVETNAAVKLNDAFIDFQTKPTIAMATTMLELAGKADNGDGKTIARTMDRIRSQSPAIFNKIQPLVSDLTSQGSTVQGGGGTTGGTTGGSKVGGTTTGGGGGGSLLQQTTAQVEGIKTAEETKRAELKPPAEARGKLEAKDINNQNFANSTYDLVKPIADLIKQSTGSGVGTGVDKLASLLGASSKGAEAIAELEVLTYPLVSNVPRFEGPQGVRDVELYERAAGDLSNGSKPVKVRLAALNAMITMLKKYDKAGANDWTFGTAKPAGGIKIISREKVQ